MKLLFYLVWLMSCLKIEGQTSWHLIKDKNNIKVYTAETDSSDFKHIKVTGLFEGTLEKVVSIFLAIDKQKEWVYGTKRSYVIRKNNDLDLLYYVETSLPWPVSNRDVAIDMKINENKSNNTLIIKTVGEPGAVPVNKGIVRVPTFTGDWYFKSEGNNKLAIEYYLFLDPGGSLPAWVVNMFVSKGPYETFSKLAELLKQ